MNRRQLLALSTALAAGSLAGCTADTEGDDEGNGDERENGDERDEPGVEPDIGDETLQELVAETNGFAFDLYGELLATNPDENLFASPVSVSIALAMSYAGAREQTREQMRQALRYTLDDDELHPSFNELQRRLGERGSDTGDGDENGSEDTDDTDGNNDAEDDGIPFELALVNSVWGQEGYPFEEAFLEILEQHYGGGLREVDYGSDAEAARQEINEWVAGETEDRIEELLPEGSLDGLTRLVLVNAIYFLANWKHPFPEDATSTERFVALDGTEHDVPMMRQERQFPYADVDGTQAVELPYVGEEVSMLLILPPEGEFEEYEAAFDETTLEELLATLDSREGTVEFPRFEFEGSFELEDSLRALGMEDAFEYGTADFSGIAPPEETDEDLYIWDVYHDTFVAVDEEGTEAAAATAVVIGDESAPLDPFEFVADRPFLFAIRDRPTGTVLFLGRAVDPGAWTDPAAEE